MLMPWNQWPNQTQNDWLRTGSGCMIDRHYIAYAARPAALGYWQGPLPLWLGSAWITLLCVVSLLARIPLAGPDAPDLHVGTLFLVITALYFLPFDFVALLPVAALVLLMRLVAGPTYGQEHLSPTLGIVVPLLPVVVLNAPLLVRTLRAPFQADPWPVRVLKALHGVAFAGVEATLLTVLDYGYRPALRAAIAAEAKRQRFRRERITWRNWGRTAACRPQVAFLPETADDLVAIVNEARGSQLRVRVAATGHSWPNLATTDDFLVITHRLDKVTVNLDDPQRPLLIAEAGATNRQINDVLQQHGLTLPFNVVLESVRIGGLVATGSHGSGWETPTLSDLVEVIEIVDASGQLVSYSAATHPPEVMNAVRLNLGLFGLIYRVTMRVEHNYRVHQRDLRIPVDEMIERIADLVPRHEGVDIYYWPYQREVTLRVWDPTEAPATIATRKTFSRVYGHAAFAVFHAWEQWVMRTWPRTTPAIATFNYRWFPFFDRVTDVVEAVHWRDAIEMLRVSCVEFAFKLDDDFSTFHRAWRDAIAVIDAYAARGLYPFNMTINARFIGTSDCLLAPASGPGQTCYIEILSSSPTPHWQEFTSEIAHAWMQLPGARPHWAKEWEYIPGIVPFLGRAYGAQLAQFLRVRDELGVDPQRMFSNALLDRVLFENPARGAAEPLVVVAASPTPMLAERH